MLSSKKKFIFIHIPRTAGTSIEVSLSRYSEDLVRPTPGGGTLIPKYKGWDNIQHFNDILFEGKPSRVYKHLNALDFKQMLNQSTQDYDEFYKFTIIRHPIDKLISLEVYLLIASLDFKIKFSKAHTCK